VLREAATVAPDALREWANERLGKAQRLVDLRVVQSLPRSDIGKVLKRQLRNAFGGDTFGTAH